MELLLHWVHSCEPSQQSFSFTVVMIHALWVKCWYFVSLHNSVSTKASIFHWKVGGAKDLMELLLQWVHSCEPSHLRSLQIGWTCCKQSKGWRGLRNFKYNLKKNCSETTESKWYLVKKGGRLGAHSITYIKGLIRNMYVRFSFCLQHGEKNLENVTHEEAVATLKATHDRVILVIAKMFPPIAVSSSPHPRKSFIFSNYENIRI